MKEIDERLEKIKLSIIMACFNNEATLERAIDSVLMQKVDFCYEIIFVSDCSTDSTVDIVKSYQKNHDNITIIELEENKGNAYAFREGLKTARGDYFCMLDGDDYYTVCDKLQKQADFLDSDINEAYASVTHYFIFGLGGNRVSIEDYKNVNDFNYFDFISGESPYFHSSTYMHRNIYKGNVPLYSTHRKFDGDTPFNTFHFMIANKKVKVLDFVGSCYSLTYKGIWTSLNQKAQCEYHVNYFNYLKKIVRTSAEKEIMDKNINDYKSMLDTASHKLLEFPEIELDKSLQRLSEFASTYAYSQREYIEKGLYYSEYIDSLCDSIGYIYRLSNKDKIQTGVKKGNICIVASKLSDENKHIVSEIRDIVEAYVDKNITILITNMKKVDKDTLAIFDSVSNVDIVCPSNESASRLDDLYQAFYNISPEKAYFYTANDDTYAMALLQPGVCENISIFSYDCGFKCGLSNPHIDVIIAKCPKDYYALERKFNDKVICIPQWRNKTKRKDLTYQPFKGHKELITACAAQNYYDVDGGEDYCYIEHILALLKTTKGKHFHFGEIPYEKLEYIETILDENDLPQNSFEILPWIDTVEQELIDRSVDIFIEPFPKVSHRLTLDVLSYGIPIISFDGMTRMSFNDLIYVNSLKWRTQHEFVNVLSKLDESILREHSQKSMAYFNCTHDFDVIKSKLITEHGFSKPLPVQVVDNIIHDTKSYLSIFGKQRKIRMMLPELQARNEDDRIKRESTMLNQIYDIEKSMSYKIGFIAMWPPKIIHQSIFAATIKEPYIGIKFKNNIDYIINNDLDIQDAFNRIVNSKASKIGRLLSGKSNSK
jgi:glycosyltransferase involved in cell wall biosynthesis